jgi:hypothetical protein
MRVAIVENAFLTVAFFCRVSQINYVLISADRLINFHNFPQNTKTLTFL